MTNSLFPFLMTNLLLRRKQFFFLGLATILTNILSLATPIVLMQAYDRVIGSQSLQTLYLLVLGASVAVILEMLLKLSKENIINHMATEFEISEGYHFVEKVLLGNTEQINSRNVGHYMDTFSSISKLKSLISGKFINSLLDLPFVVIFLALTALISPPISYYLISIFVLYFFLIMVHRKAIGKLKEDKKNIEESKIHFFIKVLTKLSSIKSSSVEERLIRKNEEMEKQDTEYSLLIQAYDSIPEIYTTFFSQAVLFGILAVGSIQVIEGNMTIGFLTACVLLGNRFFQPVNGIINFFLSLTDYQIALKKIEDVVQIPYERDSNLPPFPREITGALELEEVLLEDSVEEVEIDENGDEIDVVKIKPLLRHLSYRFPPKKVTFVNCKDRREANALVKVIIGQRTPSEGRISIDHYQISKFNNSFSNGLISYLSDRGEIFNGTVLENITMFDRSKNQMALDCATIVGLDQLISNLPKGYDTELNSKSSSIIPNSITQRIAFARVLLRRPKILIFDHTFSTLDHEGKKTFSEVILRLRGKMTIIILAKRVFNLDIVDEQIFLEKGRLSRTRADREKIEAVIEEKIKTIDESGVDHDQ